jgi:hypothetical protein
MADEGSTISKDLVISITEIALLASGIRKLDLMDVAADKESNYALSVVGASARWAQIDFGEM